jgi:hypothetical protein
MEEANTACVTCPLPDRYTWNDLPEGFIIDDGMLVALFKESNTMVYTKEEALRTYHATLHDNHKWFVLSEILYSEHDFIPTYNSLQA